MIKEEYRIMGMGLCGVTLGTRIRQSKNVLWEDENV